MEVINVRNHMFPHNNNNFFVIIYWKRKWITTWFIEALRPWLILNQVAHMPMQSTTRFKEEWSLFTILIIFIIPVQWKCKFRQCHVTRGWSKFKTCSRLTAKLTKPRQFHFSMAVSVLSQMSCSFFSSSQTWGSELGR